MANGSQPTPTPAASPPRATRFCAALSAANFADLVGQEAVARALDNALKATASPMPISSLVRAASAKPRRHASSPRRLIANMVRPARPAASAKCVAASPPARISMCWKSTAPATTAWTTSANCAKTSSIVPRGRGFKIYIIDEVHMLAEGCVQCSPEDPGRAAAPCQIHFRYHRSRKVPITILSRCQRFDFPGICLPGIVKRLGAIVRARTDDADPEALELVAAGPAVRCAMPSRCSINCWPLAASG